MLVKRVKIENFGGIQSMELGDLEQINQIVAPNAKGKTSFHQALTFCLYGTLKDKTKIYNGGDSCLVELEADVDGVPMIVRNKIQGGKCTQELCVDGGWQSKPGKELINRYFGIGSFDPDDLLDPDKRNKTFAKLIQSSFIFPDEVNKYLEKAGTLVPTKKELSTLNPVDALLKLQKGLENYRKFVGREKQSAKSVAEDSEATFQRANQAVIETGINPETLPPLSELKAKQAEIEGKKLKADELKAKKNTCEAVIKGFQLEIENLKVSLARAEENLKSEQVKLEELNQQVVEIAEAPEELLKMITAREKLDSKALFEEKKEEALKKFNEKEAEYADINKYLRQEYDKLYGQYVAEIQMEIPSIDFKDGEWTYDGKNVKTLSSSEKTRMGLDLIAIEKRKHNIILLDNFEKFDKETASKLGFEKSEGTAVFAFKVDPPNEGLKSKVINL